MAVIQEAWIGGVSTRRVDELVQAMGLAGISKSQVSKLCKDIDERVNAFLDRPIEGEWPYLWLDATYLKVARRRPHRLGRGNNRRGRATPMAGARSSACGIGPSEAETFWSAFLKSLVKRGLQGVKLVISDAHEGLQRGDHPGARRDMATLPRAHRPNAISPDGVEEPLPLGGGGRRGMTWRISSRPLPTMMRSITQLQDRLLVGEAGLVEAAYACGRRTP